MLKAYFYKLLRSPLLYVSVIGVIGVCFLRLIPNAFKGIDVLAEMNIIRSLDGCRKLFVIFGALPFAANFSDEWNSGVITNLITRKNAKKYSAANVVLCYFSALAVVFVGMMIFAGIYSAFYPFFIDEDSASQPYKIFSENGIPILDLAAVTFVFAVSCAMWTVMGLMITALFPSKYIAICAPFIFSYSVERITDNCPAYFDLWSLSLSFTNWSAMPAFLYANLIFDGISIICGIIFTKTVERRVQIGLN